MIAMSQGVAVLDAALGCKLDSFPTSYLGLPLDFSHKARGVWVWIFPIQVKCLDEK